MHAAGCRRAARGRELPTQEAQRQLLARGVELQAVQAHGLGCWAPPHWRQAHAAWCCSWAALRRTAPKPAVGLEQATQLHRAPCCAAAGTALLAQERQAQRAGWAVAVEPATGAQRVHPHAAGW